MYSSLSLPSFLSESISLEDSAFHEPTPFMNDDRNDDDHVSSKSDSQNQPSSDANMESCLDNGIPSSSSENPSDFFSPPSHLSPDQGDISNE